MDVIAAPGGHPVTTRSSMLGIPVALASSAAFATSGVLARGSMDTGWSAGATVTARIAIGAMVLIIPGLLALRGRWPVLRRGWRPILAYGLLAVATCQLAYFYAVTYLQVGVALLIEYTAPLLVVAWMWARHRQRPGRLTAVGAVIAVAGLALVLDIAGGVSLSLIGVLWALLAMVGAAAYFIISADVDSGLPPLSLAAGGLTVGALGLGLAGAVGILPMTASTDEVVLADRSIPWWAPLVLLGLISAAAAYSLGIVAGRLLGARLMSFVALAEVLFAVLFAWAALDELPSATQLAGGALILVGVVVVRAGEPRGG